MLPPGDPSMAAENHPHHHHLIVFGPTLCLSLVPQLLRPPAKTLLNLQFTQTSPPPRSPLGPHPPNHPRRWLILL